MRRLLIQASLCVTTVLAPSGAAKVTAQPTLTADAYVAQMGRGTRVVPAGQLVFDGRSFVCGSWPTVLDPKLPDYAASLPRFILLRPDVFAKLPLPVKLWIYHHECGHLRSIRDESDADCFSIALGRREGWLSAEGLDQVCRFISAGKASALHPTGTQRCAKMRQCFSEHRIVKPQP